MIKFSNAAGGAAGAWHRRRGGTIFPVVKSGGLRCVRAQRSAGVRDISFNYTPSNNIAATAFSPTPTGDFSLTFRHAGGGAASNYPTGGASNFIWCRTTSARAATTCIFIDGASNITNIVRITTGGQHELLKDTGTTTRMPNNYVSKPQVPTL